MSKAVFNLIYNKKIKQVNKFQNQILILKTKNKKRKKNKLIKKIHPKIKANIKDLLI